MKEIKVKSIFGTHQIYQEIVNYPPKGVKYLGAGENTKKGKYYERKYLKEKISWIAQRLRIPRLAFVKPGEYDIIHSSRGIIPITSKPWVMDIEHIHSFFGLNSNPLNGKFCRWMIKKILERKNCKALLCHADATLQSFEYFLDSEIIRKKLHVLYPSSHIPRVNKKENKYPIVLAVMSDFEAKAGRYVLKIFKTLSEKYPKSEFWIRADAPKELVKEYSSKNIKFFDYSKNILPRETLLKEVYSKCDIFFYPSFSDSFGYSLVDALVSKMPIVGTNLFAIPELVRDGVNGFVVKIPGYSLKQGYVQSFNKERFNNFEEKQFIKNCTQALDKILKNKSLMEKMSKNSINLITLGEVSIDARNKKLLKIYKEALDENTSN